MLFFRYWADVAHRSMEAAKVLFAWYRLVIPVEMPFVMPESTERMARYIRIRLTLLIMPLPNREKERFAVLASPPVPRSILLNLPSRPLAVRIGWRKPLKMEPMPDAAVFTEGKTFDHALFTDPAALFSVWIGCRMALSAFRTDDPAVSAMLVKPCFSVWMGWIMALSTDFTRFAIPSRVLISRSAAILVFWNPVEAPVASAVEADSAALRSDCVA